MPTYEHKCNTCQHEWEDSYSIKADPPKQCPQCQAETVVRLISLGGKGVVELTGQDLVDKVKADAQILKKDAHAKEKVYANLLGEQKYQDLQVKMDKAKKERRR
jgi:putative regulatory protein, FmdB family